MATFWRTFHHDGKISLVMVGGARALPSFTLSTIMSKVVVYVPDERADTLPIFLLYPYMCSVIRPLVCHMCLQNEGEF
jgi:hypothetical protein